MAGEFFSVFSEFNIDNNIKSLLSGATMHDVELFTEQKCIRLKINFENPVERDLIIKITEALKKQYDLQNVTIIANTKTEGFTENNYEEALALICDKVPFFKGFLKGSTATLKEGTLEITLENNGKELLRIRNFEQQFEKLILQNYKTNLTVKLSDNDKISEDLLIEEVTKVTEVKQKPKSLIIMGKEIKGKWDNISSIDLESGRVTVKGEIFDISAKDTRDGRSTILTFNITDNTSSITVKLFEEKNKATLILREISEGAAVVVKGDVQMDKYLRDICIVPQSINRAVKDERIDNAEKKRVELHCHTTMSSMDAVSSAKDIVKLAHQFGHNAVAITDHGVVQAFPDAMNAAKQIGYKGKIIYGVECYYVDDSSPIFLNSELQGKNEFVIFDVETTGFYAGSDKLTEIGAVKLIDGKITDRFSTFVNPGIPIPPRITELTGITDAMVKDADSPQKAVSRFLQFAGDAILVAHNANFDMSFINAVQRCKNAYIDTVPICRFFLKELKNHKLNTVAAHFRLPFNHHRAVDDSEVLTKIFLNLLKISEEKYNTKNIEDLNRIISENKDTKNLRPYHMILLVKNYVGLKNLYKIISQSHLNHFKKVPRVPKSLLLKYKDGLLIGSACEAGELYKAILDGKPFDELLKVASFYDYLEIQPIANNMFLIENGAVKNIEALRDINKQIVKLAESLDIPVVAAGDVHFAEPEDEIFRKILLAGQGYKDADKSLPLYFRTTDDMLSECSYLGKKTAEKVVIENPRKISDMCEEIKPVVEGTYYPKIEGSEETLREICIKRAKEIYGEDIPPYVKERMDKELNSVIKHGYAVMYVIAQRLVSKSLEDGFLVGSRGSVGSSFVAFLSGITEVNSLVPHYICENCKNSEFIHGSSFEAGCDMPDKDCPKCGAKYKKDGFDIPFETFLGFDGDKFPDIDLNFSGDYQAVAHKYTEELFGEGYVFRAGTIGTLADKTAFGFVKKYLDEKKRFLNSAEEKRLINGCVGVKRTTGQHPGGVIICPKDKEIYDFCPVQHPADDTDSKIITTHFDYHSIHDNLLKLDILGHDDPTVIKMLEDLTGINARKIPLDDSDTMSIFTTTEALNYQEDSIIGKIGSVAIPEFGTKFVRQMLVDTKPTTFAELVRISGLSHGTDVWLNNAQNLVRERVATLREVICTRDDIMLYLILKNIEPKLAFVIMESVRKGKGLKTEWIKVLEKHDVPDWYIKSCQTIQYMFPKAHAVAYVMMAFRIAYFKVHHPLAFYAAYFTVRADDFDAAIMINGDNVVKEKIKELSQMEKLTQKEEKVNTILEVCHEYYKRGFRFVPVDLYKSDAKKFLITDKGILPPLNSLAGVGVNAANTIAKERKKGRFMTVDELILRTKVTKTVIETLDKNGVLADIPKSAQMSLF